MPNLRLSTPSDRWSDAGSRGGPILKVRESHNGGRHGVTCDGCLVGRCVSSLVAPGVYGNKSGPLLESAKNSVASPAACDAGTRWRRSMSNSFAAFLDRLHQGDDAAARELFGRFTHQLIALALRHIDAGLRHKVDPEDVVQSAYKSFFFRYGAENLNIVNWNSLWGLLTLITVRKCAERVAYHRAECRDVAREASTPRGDEAA